MPRSKRLETRENGHSRRRAYLVISPALKQLIVKLPNRSLFYLLREGVAKDASLDLLGLTVSFVLRAPGQLEHLQGPSLFTTTSLRKGSVVSGALTHSCTGR